MDPWRPSLPVARTESRPQDPLKPQAQSILSSIVLQNVFAKFVRMSELKVNEGLFMPMDNEYDLAAALRPGKDLAFDRLLHSIGSLAKHCPKLVIDSIMVWRKSKSEGNVIESNVNVAGMFPQFKGKDVETVLKERKSLVSNFVLCRVLIEVINQLSKETLPNDLGEKLEEMMFGQLRNADPDLTLKSINRQANLDFFSELIGALSRIRFASVSDRFITELKQTATKENKLELVIRCMRYLKLKIYPMDALEDTTDFMQTCAEYFSNAHNIRIKHAYAEVFVELLDPIAAVATAEVNLPAWMKTIELIYPKATKMIQKPRHLPVALPLVATLLSVTKKDFFLKNWLVFLELCMSKLKDKTLKTVAFVCIIRMLWVYLFRCSETSTTSMQKRIDTLVRVVFPQGKRSIVPAETDQDMFVQFTYFVCAKFPDYGVDNVVKLLLGFDSMSYGSVNSNLTSTVAGSIATVNTAQYGSSLLGTSAPGGGYLTERSYEDLSGTSPYNYAMNSGTTSSVPMSVVSADPVAHGDRLTIVMRSFLLLLADLEEAVGGGENAEAKMDDDVTAGAVSVVGGFGQGGKIVVEGKVTLPPPPFPNKQQFSGTEGVDGLQLMRQREQDPSLLGGSGLGNTGSMLLSFSGLDPELSASNPFSLLSSTSTPTRSHNERPINLVLTPITVSRFGQSVRDALDKMNEVLGRLALTLDNACGWQLFSDVPARTDVLAPSSSDDDSLLAPSSNPSERGALFELMRTYIDTLPRFSPTGIAPVRIFQMLSRYTLHVDDQIRMSSLQALKRIAQVRNPPAQWNVARDNEGQACSVLRIFSETTIGTLNERVIDEILSLRYDGLDGCSGGTLTTYVALLDIWLKQLQSHPEDAAPSMDASKVDQIVEEIEGRGLLFLCSREPAVRKIALRILKLAAKLELALKKVDAEDLDPSPLLPPLLNPHAEQRRTTLNRPAVANRGVAGSALVSSPQNAPMLSKVASPRSQTPTQFTTLQRRNNQPSGRLRQGKTRLTRILDEASQDLVRKHFHDPFGGPQQAIDRQQTTKQQTYKAQLLSMRDALVHLATSDMPQDAAIWSRCLPDLFKLCLEFSHLRALQTCLSDVCSRLLAMQPIFQDHLARTASGTVKQRNVMAVDPTLNVPEEVVEQWRVYAVFACATIELNNLQVRPKSSGVQRGPVIRVRSDSVGESARNQQSSPQVLSVRQLLQLLLPLLGTERTIVRQAAVAALSCLHSSSYVTFLEDMRPLMRVVMEDMRVRAGNQGRVDGVGRKLSTQSPSSAPMSSANSSPITGPTTSLPGRPMDRTLPLARRIERLRMEVTHVLSLVADFVDYPLLRRNEALVGSVVGYVRECARFLSDPDVQLEWDHQVLRYYFAGLLERFYDHLAVSISGDLGETTDRYLPFELRYSLFRLFEQWCGYGQMATTSKERDAKMMISVLDQVKDARERALLAATMDEQRRALELAALKAMAALCKGPVVHPRFTNQAFDLRALVAWVDSIFGSSNDRFHGIARSALEALLTHNRSNDQLQEDIIRQCYTGPTSSQVTKGYFLALVDIISRIPDYTCLPHRMVCLALYKTGDPDVQVRRTAIRLLHLMEERFYGRRRGMVGLDTATKSSKPATGMDETPSKPEHLVELDQDSMHDEEEQLQTSDYEVAAVTSTLPIIYKYAQGMVGGRFASEHPELTDVMVSEMAMRIEMIARGMAHNMPSQQNVAGAFPFPLSAFGTVAPPQGIRDMLNLMMPYLQNVQLSVFSDLDKGHETSKMKAKETAEAVLNNVFYLTIKYGDDFVNEIESMWSCLIRHPDAEEDANAAKAASAIGNMTGVQHMLDLVQQLEVRRKQAQREQIMLATMEKNVDIIIDYLLRCGVERRNPKFVPYAKRVVIYLARSVNASYLVRALMHRITPKSMVPALGQATQGPRGMVDDSAVILATVKHGFGTLSGAGGYDYEAHDTPMRAPSKNTQANEFFMVDLNHALPLMPRRPAFSTGQLSMVLLVDLGIEIGSEVLFPHLPLLLHVVFVHMDHFVGLVCDQARLLLVNLIQSMIPREPITADRMDALLSALNIRDGKRLWPYEDISEKTRRLESVKMLSEMALQVMDVFSLVQPELPQEWGEVALSWGTTCAVRHLACRSLQIFRILLPSFSQKMLGDVLQRLSTTIADQAEEVQGFALEALVTLDIMVDGLLDGDLPLFPQFFWAATSCLHSPHEWEFLEAVRLLTKLLERMEMTDSTTRNGILVSLPTRWKGGFAGLQPLLMKGMHSSETERETLFLINKLVCIEHDALVDTNPSRILFSILANAPRMLQAFEAEPGVDGGDEAQVSLQDCLVVAEHLARLAETRNPPRPGIARLMNSYAKQRFRSKQDFLRQLASLVKDVFFPNHQIATMTFLTHMLSNRLVFYRRRTLKLLSVLYSMVDMRQTMPNSLPLDEALIQPVLSLLHTDVGNEALAVLDEAIKDNVAVSETNLRIVFGSRSVQRITKEVMMVLEPTEGLDSGWRQEEDGGQAITSMTRSNLASVASMCSSAIKVNNTATAARWEALESLARRVTMSERQTAQQQQAARFVSDNPMSYFGSNPLYSLAPVTMAPSSAVMDLMEDTNEVDDEDVGVGLTGLSGKLSKLRDEEGDPVMHALDDLGAYFANLKVPAVGQDTSGASTPSLAGSVSSARPSTSSPPYRMGLDYKSLESSPLSKGEDKSGSPLRLGLDTSHRSVSSEEDVPSKPRRNPGRSGSSGESSKPVWASAPRAADTWTRQVSWHPTEDEVAVYDGYEEEEVVVVDD